MNCFEEAIKLNDELIKLRRTFHKHPELGMEEYFTSSIIKDFLVKENIHFKEFAKTGICGVITGEKPGKEFKTIALRADMDGLPINDDKNCSYASKNKGMIHGCGHDVHITILLGAIKILNYNKHAFSGAVKFIFEPAEETVGGSKIMIKEGVLENPHVDAICGLHVDETIDCGKVMAKSGFINASSNPFSVIIKGKGGHGAYPHIAIDPIVISSNIIMSLQTIISREINPLNSALITIGSIHGGTAWNAIPKKVEINGIIRSFENKDRIFIKKRFREIIEGICNCCRASCEINIQDSYPSLYNDNFMVKLFKVAANEVVGEENIIKQNCSKLGVESFSYFAKERPGVFYFLGCRNKEKNIIYPAHSGLFDVDENCIAVGVAIQCQLAVNYLTTTEFNINL